MNNEQLLILLLGLRDELNRAIEEARANVIDALDRPPVIVRRHLPPGLCFNLACENPEHFKMVEEDADMTELDPVVLFAKVLDDRIDLLRR